MTNELVRTQIKFLHSEPVLVCMVRGEHDEEKSFVRSLGDAFKIGAILMAIKKSAPDLLDWQVWNLGCATIGPVIAAGEGLNGLLYQIEEGRHE